MRSACSGGESRSLPPWVTRRGQRTSVSTPRHVSAFDREELLLHRVEAGDEDDQWRLLDTTRPAEDARDDRRVEGRLDALARRIEILDGCGVRRDGQLAELVVKRLILEPEELAEVVA